MSSRPSLNVYHSSHSFGLFVHSVYGKKKLYNPQDKSHGKVYFQGNLNSQYFWQFLTSLDIQTFTILLQFPTQFSADDLALYFIENRVSRVNSTFPPLPSWSFSGSTPILPPLIPSQRKRYPSCSENSL